jgi:hypothetical protein
MEVSVIEPRFLGSEVCSNKYRAILEPRTMEMSTSSHETRVAEKHLAGPSTRSGTS